MMHPTHVARRRARNLMDSCDRNDAAFDARLKRRCRMEEREDVAFERSRLGPVKLAEPAPPAPKREPTKFVQRQRIWRLSFKFRGKPSPVVHRRSVPKRGPDSFRAMKAAWKRDRKRLAAEGAARRDAVVEVSRKGVSR